MRLPLKMDNDNNAPATNVELPVRVMTKNLMEVGQGKRLVEWNHKNKEKLAQESESAVGELGLLSYYIYQRGSPADNNATKVTPVRSVEVQT